MSFGELGRRGPGARTSTDYPSRGVGGPPGGQSGTEWGGSRNGNRPSQASRRAAGSDVEQTTAKITEWLRQFQYNLSLLERLAESLDAQGTRPTDESLRQVSSQQDVVEELGATVRRGLSELSRQIEALPRPEQARPRVAHAKLKRDSERVAQELTRVLNKLKQSRRNALTRKPAAMQPLSSSGGPGSYAQEPHRVGRAQFGRSDAPGDLDVMIGDERVQLQVAMQEEAINDAILQEREEEIREINQSVHKVNEIFRDLANLVDKQQHEVDQISELVEKSHQHAEKGLDQVQKAARLQPSCTLS